MTASDPQNHPISPQARPAMARRHILLLLIIALAYMLNGLGIWWEPGQPDEIVYRSLPHQGAWDWHPHTFKFPSLHLYIVRLFAILPSILLHRAGLIGDYHWRFALFLGRSITLLMSLGVVFLTYLIGRHVFNSKVGLVAALLLALNYLFVNISHFATTDIPALFWTLLALYAVVRLRPDSRPKNFIFCGFLAGLAISAKFLGGVVLLVALAQVLTWTLQHSLSIRQFAARIILLAAFAILAFALTSPFFILDIKNSINDLLYLRDIRLGSGKSLPLVKSLQILPKRLWMILTPPWFLTFLAALAYHLFCLKRRRFFRSLPLITYLAVFILLFELLWNMTYRLHIVFIPVIAILTANFIFRINFSLRRTKTLQFLLWLLFAALIFFLLLNSALVTYYFLNDTRNQAEKFISSNTPAGSIFTFNSKFPMYFPRVKPRDQFLPLQLVDPQNYRLEFALKDMNVNYIILSSLWSYQAKDKEKELYDDLNAGLSDYRPVARFERETFLGLKPRAIEFISPTISIFKLSDPDLPENSV